MNISESHWPEIAMMFIMPDSCGGKDVVVAFALELSPAHCSLDVSEELITVSAHLFCRLCRIEVGIVNNDSRNIG